MPMRPLRFSIALISLGLALLAAFLFFFLKKTWDDEAVALQRETGLLFVNAVQREQNRVFDRLLVRQFESDSTFDISLQMPHLPQGDSVKMVAFVQEKGEFKTVLEEKSDSTRMIRIETTRIPEREKTDVPRTFHFETSHTRVPSDASVTGTLSVFVGGDSVCSDAARPKVLEVLHKNFGEAMQKSGLAVGWQVVRLEPDSATLRRPLLPGEVYPTHSTWARKTPAAEAAQGIAEVKAKPGAFIAGEYRDLVSGERYVAEISAYGGYLLRKTLPQMLFALLLFGCMATAFGLMYRSLRQQQRLTELKNDFIRNMTHELKTPIATVSVAIEALQNFDALSDSARTHEYLDISRLELNRLSLLVDKVLRMSLFEQGEPELKSEPLDLRLLVEEVLAAMKIQFEKYRAEINFSASGENFVLRGDRLHLTSVVYNLLDNALKYSPSAPQIAVSLTQSGGHLALQVSDRGRGIPAAYRERIFEKFFRVPTGDVHDVKGHGLGLSYVAGVVRLHGGSIGVESVEGEGASFEIKLPVQDATFAAH